MGFPKAMEESCRTKWRVRLCEWTEKAAQSCSLHPSGLLAMLIADGTNLVCSTTWYRRFWKRTVYYQAHIFETFP